MNRKEVEKNFREYIEKNSSINEYETLLRTFYSDFVKKDENHHYFGILNDFYLEEDKVLEFQDILKNENIRNYFEKEYMSLLKISNDKNIKYHIKANDNNVNSKNFIKNGTLVFKLQRILDFNINLRVRIKSIKNLESSIQEMEEKLSNSLKVPVQILFDDILIPPKKK